MGAESNKIRYASALESFFSIALIASGVSVLLWLSTLGDNDIRGKIEFFSTVAGKTLIMISFVIPLTFIIHKISCREMTAKKLALSIVILITLQLILLAYTPVILKAYQSAGETIGDLIINS